MNSNFGLSEIENRLPVIESESANVTEEYRQRLTKKIGEMLAKSEAQIELDQGTTCTGNCLFIRTCRHFRRNHEIEKPHRTISPNNERRFADVGKRLDFLTQELNREANTIASKTQNLIVKENALVHKIGNRKNPRTNSKRRMKNYRFNEKWQRISFMDSERQLKLPKNSFSLSLIGSRFKIHEFMYLSEVSRRIFQDFCGECSTIKPQTVPPVRFFTGGGAGFLTKLLNINGITFGRSVIINPDLIRRDDGGKTRAPSELIAHELAHVLQYERLGYVRFLYIYLRDWWRIFKSKPKWNSAARREAYFDIPHEIEARRFAGEYLGWREINKLKN